MEETLDIFFDPCEEMLKMYARDSEFVYAFVHYKLRWMSDDKSPNTAHLPHTSLWFQIIQEYVHAILTVYYIYLFLFFFLIICKCRHLQAFSMKSGKKKIVFCEICIMYRLFMAALFDFGYLYPSFPLCMLYFSLFYSPRWNIWRY